MPTKFVTITGLMTFEDTPTPPVQPPLGIWGPTDPRPTLPIAGWNPGSGTFPPFIPPGIWGPTDPRPTLPIAGWNPITGQFPPWFPIPPVNPPAVMPPFPGQLPASHVPGWVFGYVPGYGWMWAFVPPTPPTEPPPVGPEVPVPTP